MVLIYKCKIQVYIRCQYILSSSISSYTIYTNNLILFHCILFLKIIIEGLIDRTKKNWPHATSCGHLIHKGQNLLKLTMPH